MITKIIISVMMVDHIKSNLQGAKVMKKGGRNVDKVQYNCYESRTLPQMQLLPV